MSYDTNRTFAYTLHGNKLRLYRYRSSAKKLVDTEGRVDGEGWDPLIYPDETISSGLRIEYTSLVKPFINKDPETTAESLDDGDDGGEGGLVGGEPYPNIPPADSQSSGVIC